MSKIASYKPYCMVDGEGVRCSLYVSGCPFACKGCYNVVAQNFNYGVTYTKELEEQILTDLSPDYCQGLSLLGGEPFCNIDTCTSLLRALRERYGDTKDVWCWTGYTYDELLTGDKFEMLKMIDVLIDGKFELDKRDLTLRFRGSSNQRIIDVKNSIAKGCVVEWLKVDDTPKRKSIS